MEKGEVDMNKYYETPQIEFLEIEIQDVICASDPIVPPIMGEDDEGSGSSTKW